MSGKIIPPILACIVLGFILGIVPFVSENLHWNLYYFIPVSGLILGAAMGCLCFWICFNLNERVRTSSIIILAFAAAAGYLAVDYGTYYSRHVTVEGVEAVPDGEYRISEIMSFGQYMRWRLETSTISTGSSRQMELGTLGTTVSFIIDLIGALVGSAFTLFVSYRKYPFCESCLRYMNRENKYRAVFKYDPDTAEEIFSTIESLKENSDYEGMVSYAQQLSESCPSKKGDIMINFDQRRCPVCRQAVVLGDAKKRAGRGWKEIRGFRFSLASQSQVQAAPLEPAMQMSI